LGRPAAAIAQDAMTLVDTSVWINHFRLGERRLAALLEESSAGVHPFVIGELACGNLRHRAATLGDLAKLPHAKAPTEAEVHHILESRGLCGNGLG
jgi:predicted nucleic acid-binding protein